MRSDWKPFKSTLKDDLECGFIDQKALDQVDKLSPDEVRRLAAIALTCWESEWSDCLRDLMRGISCIMGKLPKSDR